MKLMPKKEKMDFEMCRICQDQRGTIPIFSSAQPNIPEEIQNIAGVSIIESDDLPKHICERCLDLLNGCIRFRELCQSTNKKMIELCIKQEQPDSPETNTVIEEPLKNENEYCNILSPTLSDDLEVQTCMLCNQDFSDKKLYKKHLYACKKKKKLHKVSNVLNIKSTKGYLCHVCGKTCQSKANLLSHMGTHESIFPFKCDECPYKGRTMELLKVHKRSHLVDKPYKCTQCPKSYTTASNIAKHMRQVHSTSRPFKCAYCEKAFSFQYDMRRHINDSHLRQATVACDICSKKFNSKKTFMGHKWKVHKIKGDRQGRLPMYLQRQIEENNHSNHKRVLSARQQTFDNE